VSGWGGTKFELGVPAFRTPQPYDQDADEQDRDRIGIRSEPEMARYSTLDQSPGV